MQAITDERGASLSIGALKFDPPRQSGSRAIQLSPDFRYLRFTAAQAILCAVSE